MSRCLIGVFIWGVLTGGGWREAAAQMTITPSLGMVGRYDDNILSVEEGREEDFITVASPGVTLSYRGRSGEVAVSYRGEFETFATNSDLNIFRHDGGITMTPDRLIERILRNRNLRVQVSEAVTYIPEPPVFPSRDRLEGGASRIRTRRTDTLQNSAMAHISYTLTPRLSFGIGYANTLERFRGTELIDTDRHASSVTTEYALTPRVTFESRYTFEAFEFDRGGEAILHALSGGGGFRLIPTLFLAGRIGGIYQREERTLNLLASASLTKTFQTTSIAVGYNRGMGTGSGLIGEVTRSQSGFFSLVLQITRFMTGQIKGDYGRQRGGGINTTSFGGEGGLGYQITSWLTGSFSYSYFHQESRGTVGEDIRKNMATLSFTAIYPSPIRFFQ